METPPTRAYDHRFHAGNVGDVWKHAALLAWLERTRAPRLVIETHAGAGRYALGPTGEWTEGVGRLWTLEGELPISSYLARTREYGPRSYPGSPLLITSALGSEDRYLAHELAPEPLATLRSTLKREPRAEISGDDGLEALASAVESAGDREPWVLVDPPYADRAEWSLVPRAIGRALERRPDARFMLWYPIKSHARPNAMFIELAAHCAGVALELLTSPLTFKKNRLNGSGLVLVNAPEGTIEALAAISAWLGPRLSVSGGYWSTRGVAWARGERP